QTFCSGQRGDTGRRRACRGVNKLSACHSKTAYHCTCYIERVSSSSNQMTSNLSTSAGEKFQLLVNLMARLRAPGGCPWDREQTFDTIKPYLLEETYEVMDAIDARDWPEL